VIHARPPCSLRSRRSLAATRPSLAAPLRAAPRALRARCRAKERDDPPPTLPPGWVAMPALCLHPTERGAARPLSGAELPRREHASRASSSVGQARETGKEPIRSCGSLAFAAALHDLQCRRSRGAHWDLRGPPNRLRVRTRMGMNRSALHPRDLGVVFPNAVVARNRSCGRPAGRPLDPNSGFRQLSCLGTLCVRLPLLGLSKIAPPPYAVEESTPGCAGLRPSPANRLPIARPPARSGPPISRGTGAAPLRGLRR